MLLLPVRTPVLQPSDDLAAIIKSHSTLASTDIVVMSSKAIAMTEGSAMDLSSLTVSQEALVYAEKTGRSPEFMQAVIEETNRLHGVIVGTCPGALLTDLRPEGLQTGTILAPNAGLDESNVPLGTALGWPHDPVASAKRLRNALGCAVIISDSCCRPGRMGVTAFALSCAGIDPLRSEIGNTDLFGKTMRVTVEATADQLAIAANAVMGNVSQSTPAVIVREHGIPLSDFVGWVPGIEPETDLFKDILHYAHA